MKIAIREHSGRKIRLVVPTGLLLNRFTAKFISGIFEKKGFPLTQTQVLAVIQAIHSCRRKHRGWKLIEVKSAAGDEVEIVL